ncbi:mannosyl-oligosaccharide alpha-1,2-mannosidase [Nowakowskiella sp. JEL0078]|nr:mannosyl-oligosaccharide alpha-1,2-mannosidase [Nowakowskiella sp. JEL0078]
MLFRSNLSADERVSSMRRQREMREADEQAKVEKKLMDFELISRERNAEMEREKLVRLMEEKKLEELREEKVRQSIRENSEELRDLEKKLDSAYMNKERALQIKEKQYQAHKEKIIESELIVEMNRCLEVSKQIELEKEKQIYDESRRYKKALQQQLQDMEAKKQAEFEQFLREKSMVDEIVHRIIEEDEKKARERLEKQKEAKRYIEEFLYDRRVWREQERELHNTENKK